MIDIPVDTIVFHILIELRFVSTYCFFIDETELDDGLPWYHDIYQFMRFDTYPEVATTKDIETIIHTVCDLWGDTIQMIN